MQQVVPVKADCQGKAARSCESGRLAAIQWASEICGLKHCGVSSVAVFMECLMCRVVLEHRKEGMAMKTAFAGLPTMPSPPIPLSCMQKCLSRVGKTQTVSLPNPSPLPFAETAVPICSGHLLLHNVLRSKFQNSPSGRFAV